MGYWPKHPKKDLEALLQFAHEHGWTINRGSKYYKLYCGCTKHKRTVHLSPSDPGYARNVQAWLRRQACWKEGGAVRTGHIVHRTLVINVNEDSTRAVNAIDDLTDAIMDGMLDRESDVIRDCGVSVDLTVPSMTLEALVLAADPAAAQAIAVKMTDEVLSGLAVNVLRVSDLVSERTAVPA